MELTVAQKAEMFDWIDRHLVERVEFEGAGTLFGSLAALEQTHRAMVSANKSLKIGYIPNRPSFGQVVATLIRQQNRARWLVFKDYVEQYTGDPASVEALVAPWSGSYSAENFPQEYVEPIN